jgi:hypothetical protein
MGACIIVEVEWLEQAARTESRGRFLDRVAGSPDPED